MKTIILSGAVALVIALLGTPLFIGLMRRLGYGQPIRVEGLKSHESKRGTPTMGGAVFVSASLIAYAAGHALTGTGVTASGLLVLMMMMFFLLLLILILMMVMLLLLLLVL